MQIRHHMHHFHFRVLAAIILVLVFLVIGTVGIRIIEKWSWVDSFYFASLTITGIGSEGLSPATESGRVFVGVYAIISVGVLFGTFILIFQPLVKRWFRFVLETEERVEKKIRRKRR